MATPVKLPQTVDDLTTDHALSPEDQRVRCNICREAYSGHRTDSVDDRPVELPTCGHIFGARCIAGWIQTEKNNCPICRIPVLSPGTPDPDVDEQDDQQEVLASWPVKPSDRGQLHPCEWMFQTLCEETVCYIEDPSVSTAQEWLEKRAPFRDIVGIGTFKQFVKVVTGDSSKLKDLVNRLSGVLPNEVLVDFCVEQALQYQDMVDDARMEADEHTFSRLEAWYRRIRKSRDALYERLYGTSVPTVGSSP
ncbi:MAG: hypothetical protein Q9183_005419 [Haloplaca sp. 2 TL-2023]